MISLRTESKTNASPLRLWLIRHGETEWSQSGAHTSRTDIPLTSRGERKATAIRDFLDGRHFSLVLTSPMQRARETCRIAGYGDVTIVDDALSEWNYGIYEGCTTEEIRKKHPNWSVWKDVLPKGETLEEVGYRARTVIERSLAVGGDVALFAHAHVLRILTACWLDLTPDAGRLFALSTGSISILGHEREIRVVHSWNRSFEIEA